MADASATPARGGLHPALPTGFVVSDLMVLVLVLLALTGAFADRPLLAALGAVVLLATLIARVWTRVALDGVRYACAVSAPSALAGDVVTLTVTLENHKPVPVPWLRVREAIPAGLALHDGTSATRGLFGTTWLLATTALGPHERVRLRYRLHAKRRGYYVLGPGRLSAGDPFGFYESERLWGSGATALVVYPSIPPMPRLWPALARPVGRARARTLDLDDPTLPVSLREYRPGDPASAIHWKATARRGTPWVRVNDSSVDGAVALLVECDTRARGPWDDSPELLEDVVCTAAGVARGLLARGHAVGLVANGIPPGDRARVALAPGAGRAQLRLVLEALARIQSLVVKPLAELVEEQAPRALPLGTTLLAIGALVRPQTGQLLTTRAARGTHALLLYLGDDEPAPLAGVRTVRYRPPQPGADRAQSPR